MPKFTRIPVDTFDTLQINAGVMLKDFDPVTGTMDLADILTATTGGITVNVKNTYKDLGENIDNCPKDTMELKLIESTEVSMSGTALKADASMCKIALGAADVDSTTGALVPRSDLKLTDFSSYWFVGDTADGGFVAVKIMNALSTDGFSLKTTDKGQGNIAFTLTGHRSLYNQDVIPAEFYFGEADDAPLSVTLNRTIDTIEDGKTDTLIATASIAGATIVWDSTDTSVATVSDGVVTAVDPGQCVITVKATKSGESAMATCIVTVVEAESEG